MTQVLVKGKYYKRGFDFRFGLVNHKVSANIKWVIIHVFVHLWICFYIIKFMYPSDDWTRYHVKPLWCSSLVSRIIHLNMFFRAWTVYCVLTLCCLFHIAYRCVCYVYEQSRPSSSVLSLFALICARCSGEL